MWFRQIPIQQAYRICSDEITLRELQLINSALAENEYPVMFVSDYILKPPQKLITSTAERKRVMAKLLLKGDEIGDLIDCYDGEGMQHSKPLSDVYMPTPDPITTERWWVQRSYDEEAVKSS